MEINFVFLCARGRHWEQAGASGWCCETSPANKAQLDVLGAKKAGSL